MASIIDTLKAEGALVMFHDYRNRNFNDLSGNSNDGTPTDVAFTGQGINYPASTSDVSVADSSELQLTAGTLIVFNKQGFTKHVNLPRLISKRDGGGTNWDWFLSGTTDLGFFDGASSRTLTTNFAGKKYVAINFTNGGTPEGFSDGVSDGNYSGTVSISTDNAAVTIGNISVTSGSLLQSLSSALIVNRVLTATEHSQLYGELMAIKWPTKPTTISNAGLKVDASEAGLVGGWNMKPQGNQIIDQSTAGNDGTINGTVKHESTPLGDSLVFDGVTGFVDVGSTGQTVKSVGFWVNPVTTTEDFMDLDGGTHTIEASGGTVTATGFASPTIYVDGIVGSTIVAGLWQYIFVTTATGFTASDLDIGKETIFLEGSMIMPELFSDEKSAAFVTTKYNEGKQALWKSDWGLNESVSTSTAGFLENSPFTIQSGTWKVSMDTINGQDVKVAECTVAGVISVPTSHFQQTPNEGAFGEWELYFNKADASALNIQFISSSDVFASSNGYRVALQTDEACDLEEVATGTPTALFTSAAAAFTAATWTRLNVPRTNVGAFTVKLDGTNVTAATGSNPVTDTTFETSTHILIDADAGDKIALSDVGGGHSINKHLTI